MHPELLNNSLFLRYYRQWQEDPTSIVFVPIAEYLLLYGMTNEAYVVCSEGLRKHPKLISGHIVMAKIEMTRGRLGEAEEAVRRVQDIVPYNPMAEELMNKISERRAQGEGIGGEGFTNRTSPTSEGPSATTTFSWNTLTMAKIYAAQGHHEQARVIYHSILKGDPNNEAARAGLASLP